MTRNSIVSVRSSLNGMTGGKMGADHGVPGERGSDRPRDAGPGARRGRSAVPRRAEVRRGRPLACSRAERGDGQLEREGVAEGNRAGQRRGGEDGEPKLDEQRDLDGSLARQPVNDVPVERERPDRQPDQGGNQRWTGQLVRRGEEQREHAERGDRCDDRPRAQEPGRDGRGTEHENQAEPARVDERPVPGIRDR